MGYGDGRRRLFEVLARAAGLSVLTTATMASGPCGGACWDDQDWTYSLDELRSEREAALAAAVQPGLEGQRSVAESWDGAKCPTMQQVHAMRMLLSEPTEVNGALLEEKAGTCLYRDPGGCGEGRPFLVNGQARVGAVRGSSPRARRSALADAWLEDARLEHASIAAFARLSLQLLSLGAPAELVEEAQLASLDELRHAEFCFAMASHHAGEELGPGPLAVRGALDDLSLAGLIESNLLEGCIGETLAAERLRCRAGLCVAPELSDALLRMAEDETRHAELAFRIFAWCREQAPQLTRAVVDKVLAANEGDAASADETTADEDSSYVAERGSRRLLRHSDRSTWQLVLSPLLAAAC